MWWRLTSHLMHIGIRMQLYKIDKKRKDQQEAVRAAAVRLVCLSDGHLHHPKGSKTDEEEEGRKGGCKEARKEARKQGGSKNRRTTHRTRGRGTFSTC